MIDVTTMSVEEALDYCYKNKEEYIRGFDKISVGVRQFECLIEILESGTIKPKDLPDYGMSEEHLKD